MKPYDSFSHSIRNNHFQTKIYSFALALLIIIQCTGKYVDKFCKVAQKDVSFELQCLVQSSLRSTVLKKLILHPIAFYPLHGNDQIIKTEM